MRRTPGRTLLTSVARRERPRTRRVPSKNRLETGLDAGVSRGLGVLPQAFAVGAEAEFFEAVLQQAAPSKFDRCLQYIR